ncbi:MAG: hypothetical protein DBX59_00715 [Bacillota bacterium]|nr:MAG: hypothetical protein DBX59_00715 [Bacillota bacterium]
MRAFNELLIFKKDEPTEIAAVIEVDDSPRSEIDKGSHIFSYPAMFGNGRLMRCDNGEFGVSFGLLPHRNMNDVCAEVRENSVSYKNVLDGVDVASFPTEKGVRFQVTLNKKRFEPCLVYFKLNKLDFLVSDDGLDIDLFKKEIDGRMLTEEERFQPHLHAMTVRSSNAEDRMGAFSSRGVMHYLYIFNDEEVGLSFRTGTQWYNSYKREFPIKINFEICFDACEK